MLSLLGHYVNRRVLISLPAILGKPEPLECVLVACEASGVWLSSRNLTKQVYSESSHDIDTPVFIPYAQVGFLVSVDVRQGSRPPAGPTAEPQAREHHPKRNSPRKRR